RGDRIGFVGPNGSGKSTLLKLLGARGSADDRGDVRRGTNLKEGYFDQHLGSLNPDRTAVDEIRSVRGDLNVDGARQYLARFRFYGDDPLRRVASFSGGERTRLALAKLLLEPRNLLFLDEPTNHLDIPAAEILEEALVGFEGTVLLVSHDRRFLENVTTRTVAFTAEGIDIYEGGFKDYSVILERNARAKDPNKGDGRSSQNRPPEGKSRDNRKPSADNGGSKDATTKQSASASSKPQPDTGRPELGADAHRARRAQVREVERKQKRVSELESAISKSEAEVQTLREELRAASGSDWEKLHKLAGRERELTLQLERLTEEWLRLSEELQNVL
ncbi:MAG TPA: ATP-binding cassette domain-containing protein, partial [Polyangiaceae bacterium]|nr:ATP-binding cassette domain-containing protein [Polyangiaceae bacterium]